jgi:hypothetical protein
MQPFFTTDSASLTAKLSSFAAGGGPAFAVAVACSLLLTSPARHPERSSLRTLQAAQSKDPESARLPKTARRFLPTSSLPLLLLLSLPLLVLLYSPPPLVILSAAKDPRISLLPLHLHLG